MIVYFSLGVNQAFAQVSHASCKRFGEATMEGAQSGVMGVNTSLLASSDPNVISDGNEPYMELLCDPR